MSKMTDAPPGIGDISQVAVPTPQEFFVNPTAVPSSVGRGTAADPGNFTESPAFTGNVGKPEGSRNQV